jgi:hypothetical protein
MRTATLAALGLAICQLHSASASPSVEADFYHGMRFGKEAERTSETTMHLFKLNDTAISGAVCLDGTPAGFYFSPATSLANQNDWQIYFQGGGW